MSMLRTITTLLLVALLTVATTGVSVVYHYCAGELDSVALFVGGKTCGCGSETPKSCCSDRIALHKLTVDCRIGSVAPSVQLLIAAALPSGADAVALFHKTHSEAKPAVDTSPPRTTDIPVFTCALLI